MGESGRQRKSLSTDIKREAGGRANHQCTLVTIAKRPGRRRPHTQRGAACSPCCGALLDGASGLEAIGSTALAGHAPLAAAAAAATPSPSSRRCPPEAHPGGDLAVLAFPLVCPLLHG